MISRTFLSRGAEFIHLVTSRPSPLNQANFFNRTLSAEQPVPAAGGGD